MSRLRLISLVVGSALIVALVFVATGAGYGSGPVIQCTAQAMPGNATGAWDPHEQCVTSSGATVSSPGSATTGNVRHHKQARIAVSSLQKDSVRAVRVAGVSRRDASITHCTAEAMAGTSSGAWDPHEQCYTSSGAARFPASLEKRYN